MADNSSFVLGGGGGSSDGTFVTLSDESAGIPSSYSLGDLTTGLIYNTVAAGVATLTQVTATAAGLALLDDANAAAQRVTMGVQIGVNVQAFDATLAALAAYNTNGILTQTAADTFVGRTMTGTANEITVTNGDGVAGAPTWSLPAAMTFTGKTVTGGTFAGATATTFTFTSGSIGSAVTATTQSLNDSSTKVATTEYVNNTVKMGQTDVACSSVSTFTQDIDTNHYFELTFTSNCTLAFTFNAGLVQSMCIELINAGAYTITWPAALEWTGGAPPTFTTAGTDVIVIWNNGDDVQRASLIGQDYS